MTSAWSFAWLFANGGVGVTVGSRTRSADAAVVSVGVETGSSVMTGSGVMTGVATGAKTVVGNEVILNHDQLSRLRMPTNANTAATMKVSKPKLTMRKLGCPARREDALGRARCVCVGAASTKNGQSE